MRNVLRTLVALVFAHALLLQGCSSAVPVDRATEAERMPVDPRPVDPLPTTSKPSKPIGEAARTERESWSRLIKSGREHLKRRELPEAEDKFTRAYDLTRDFRASDVRTKSSIRNLQRLASAYLKQGNSASFGRVMDLLIYICGEEPVARTPGVAKLLQELASTRSLQKRHQDARDALLLSLAILEEKKGTEKSVLSGTYSQLGLVQLEAGNLDAAQAAIDRASEIALSEGEGAQEKGPLYAKVLVPRAKLELARGNARAARDAMREAMEITEDRFGVESRATAQIVRELALFEQQTGSHGEALKYFNRAIAIWDVLAGEQFQRAQSRNELAWFLVETGQPELAEAPARSAFELFEAAGASGQTLAAVADTLATALRDQQKHEEAETLYRIALTEGTKAKGLAGWDVTPIADRYAELLDRTGRDGEAEELRRRWHETEAPPEPPADAGL